MHKRNNVAETSPILGSARPYWAALDGGRAIGRSNLGRVASQANALHVGLAVTWVWFLG